MFREYYCSMIDYFCNEQTLDNSFVICIVVYQTFSTRLVWNSIPAPKVEVIDIVVDKNIKILTLMGRPTKWASLCREQNDLCCYVAELTKELVICGYNLVDL